jgi:hypothetical protein
MEPSVCLTSKVKLFKQLKFQFHISKALEFFNNLFSLGIILNMVEGDEIEKL